MRFTMWSARRHFSALIVPILFVLSVALPATGSVAALPFPASLARAFAGPSFIFTAAGDYGTGPDVVATLELIPTSGADFHLALGDLSYDAPGTEPAWCELVKSVVGPSFPFQLLAGNHEADHGGNGHIDNFAACLPDRLGGITGAYAKEYYFDYQGLVRFVLVSPNLTINGHYYAYTAGSRRYRWVAEVIDGARAAGIPWVVAGMHENCITIGEKSCEIGADLWNLLIAKKVDLVLQAHDHSYQRSKQLALSPTCTAIPLETFSSSCVVDAGPSDSFKKGHGTVSVITGAAGRQLYDLNTADPEIGYFAKWMGRNVSPRRGLVKLTVTDTQIVGEFLAPSSTSAFSDRFSITQAPPTFLSVVATQATSAASTTITTSGQPGSAFTARPEPPRPTGPQTIEAYPGGADTVTAPVTRGEWQSSLIQVRRPMTLTQVGFSGGPGAPWELRRSTSSGSWRDVLASGRLGATAVDGYHLADVPALGLTPGYYSLHVYVASGTLDRGTAPKSNPDVDFLKSSTGTKPVAQSDGTFQIRLTYELTNP
ncbi:MAG: metallophosphoesterase [Chloroflexi bacterium]|nr:metallophosphoesterase [Chloroflexota bacterium]